MKMKRLLGGMAIALATILTLGLTACNKPDAPQDENETESITWINKTWEFTNANGEKATLDYAIYLPDSYSETGDGLPLVGFLPDSGFAGSSIEKFCKDTECAKNWITSERMEKHPAIFVTMAITAQASNGRNDEAEESTVSVNDAEVEGSDASQIVPIIQQVCKDYNVDENRLYWTGQSMGGIMGFSINAKYPDLFAATVYVGCQPGDKADRELSEMYGRLLDNGAFLNQKWIYITSRRDVQAHAGQDDIEQILIDEGIEYGKAYNLDVKQDSSYNSDIVKAELEKGYDKNLFGYEYIFSPEPEPVSIQEHLSSFRYIYALDSVFDWLFEQHK